MPSHVPEPNAGRARIYISFASSDRAHVMALVRWLNDSGWQVRADDRHSFAADEDWTKAAARRLDSCDVVLCVITAGWLASDFCRFEFSYCAKRGKFVVPVIYERADVGMLPPAMRALPSVDLTRNRLLDYLALKETLSQAGSAIAGVSAMENKPARRESWLRVLADRCSWWRR